MRHAFDFEIEPFELQTEIEPEHIGASTLDESDNIFESLDNEFDAGEFDNEFDASEHYGELEANLSELEGGANLPKGSLGRLVVNVPGRQVWSYSFTSEDLVWTARFLMGEAGGRDDIGNQAVIWAMLNRYGLFTHKYYQSLHQFLRAYSTPLQAVLKNVGAVRRHMKNPDFVSVGGSYPGTTVPRGQLGRFLRMQRTPWNSLPRGARSLAVRALSGQVPNPIGNATEFGNTSVYFRDKNRRLPADYNEWRRFTEAFAQRKGWAWVGPITGLNQRGNAFFVQRRVQHLPIGSVRILGATGGGSSASDKEIASVRGIRVSRSIAPQITSLLNAAQKDGVDLGGWGYRSNERQIELRRRHCGTTHYDIYDKPSSRCHPPTARPGRSMHERGLAVDFTYRGAPIRNHGSPGYQWLARNASRYGLFNLPSEPWHWSTTGN